MWVVGVCLVWINDVGPLLMKKEGVKLAVILSGTYLSTRTFHLSGLGLFNIWALGNFGRPRILALSTYITFGSLTQVFNGQPQSG